jgi:hypothetical protein
MSKLLWTPSQERIQASNMVQFMQWINEHFALDLNDYPPMKRCIDDATKMPGAQLV